MQHQSLVRLNALRQVLAAIGKAKPIEMSVAEGRVDSVPRRSSREMDVVSSKLYIDSGSDPD